MTRAAKGPRCGVNAKRWPSGTARKDAGRRRRRRRIAGQVTLTWSLALPVVVSSPRAARAQAQDGSEVALEWQLRWTPPAALRSSEVHAASEGKRAPSSREATWGELRPPTQPVTSVPVWHSVGLLLGLRLSEAVLWPEVFAETRLSVIGERYADAFTMPPKWDADQAPFEWDGDPWPINVVGHALMGSELYYRPRACGHGVLASLGFATAGTVLWDYGLEASGVRPSGLDLWYTPLAGMLLGEVRYWGYRAASTIDDVTFRTLVQSVFDPFGQLERGLGTRC